ncbi:MAG: hypothetical protein PHR38_01420 [Bacteroidales bacterium]|nr:hypothetical protein [Bacteroidales bacterium]MDD4712435.1 hypothetical protein [Bacteroidales bacterium]
MEPLPNEGSVLILMDKTAMDKTSYQRYLLKIYPDQKLFPPDGKSFSPTADKEIRFRPVAQG